MIGQKVRIFSNSSSAVPVSEKIWVEMDANVEKHQINLNHKAKNRQRSGDVQKDKSRG